RIVLLGAAWDATMSTPRRRLLPAKRLPIVARELLADGWHVEAEGKSFRRPKRMRFGVASGVDWFDLNAHVDYEGASIALPTLLAALRRGESVIPLDDGSFGMLPEDWLRSFGGLAAFGSVEGDAVRFRRSQLGLLDALLSEETDFDTDAVFTHARE